jgi:hypothetical protein
MRAKGFPLLIPLVILTASPGCDNVEWGGTEFTVEPPPAVEAPPVDEDAEFEEVRPDPVVLGPLLYLVQRQGDGRGRLLPVAVRGPDGYGPLPDPAETPDLVERFPLERWEAGTEFILFSGGVRSGILTSDGSSELDASWCLPRAVGGGSLELRPGAMEQEWFLALRRDDPGETPSSLEPLGPVAVDDDVRNASLDAARALIPRLGVPWPPSVLGIRERIGTFIDGEGNRALAVSFVFDDGLRVGTPGPNAYSLFIISSEVEGAWEPAFSWHQRTSGADKQVPGFLAAHDVRATGSPDMVFELFGADDRWIAILGGPDDPSIIFRDPCGRDPAPNALRVHR